MKAAVFREPHVPLLIEEMPEPTYGPQEMLIKVAACGICHTDLHHVDHGVPTFQKPPIILGHEPTGVVAEVGSDVKGFKAGDRVILPAGYPCGHCYYCQTGRGNICQGMLSLGGHRNGAYAEYIAMPERAVFHLPEEIPLEEGCVLADAVASPYHAIKNRAQVKPGDTVAVFGCGGLGLNAIQLAVLSGGTVIAVDLLDRKLEMAKEFGATYTVNPSQEDAAKLIRKLTGGGADIALEVIGNSKVAEQALNSLRPGGRLVMVGYANDKMALNSGRVMYQEMEIMGSCAYRLTDYQKVINLAAQGRIRYKDLVTHKYPLAEINEAMETLRKGEGIRIAVVI